MSKYRFKKKTVVSEEVSEEVNNGDRIMNASASENESTAVYRKQQTKIEIPSIDDNDFFIPVYETNKRKKQSKKEKKKSFFSALFAKFKADDDDYGTFITQSEETSIQPIEEFPEEAKKVSEADETTAAEAPEKPSEKSISDTVKYVTADSNSVDIPKEVSNASEEKESESAPEITDEAETDTYVGLENTAIEVDEDSKDKKDDKEVEASKNEIPADENTPIEVNVATEASDKKAEEAQTSIYDEDNNSVTKRPRKIREPKKIKKAAKSEKEYTSPDQKEKFLSEYRSKIKLNLLLFLATAVLSAVLIYLETKSFPHPKWLMPGRLGVAYLMADLQLVFLTGVCVLSSLINGAKKLFTWKPDRDSVTFISFTVAVLHIILHASVNAYSKDISLYSAVFAICATVTAFSGYLDSRREYSAFKIASHSGTKMTVSPLDKSSAEYTSFENYLDEDSTLYKRSSTEFVNGFFRTTREQSPYSDTYKISIPLVTVASLVFAVLVFAISKDSTMCDAINNFTRAFMLSMPLSSIFVVVLPFFATSLRLSKSKSAILSEASIEKYANASLVSFSDTDIFNHRGIQISSIQTYGKVRIDTTYLLSAKVLKMIGGPLDEVFNKSVIPSSSDDSDNKIIAITENGITAFIDGHDVMMGNREFVIQSGLDPIIDAGDSDFTAHNGRILYVAINGEISAKFYVKYAIGSNFKQLLDSFLGLGVCITINTRDPNIDTDFALSILGSSEYPIVVVKDTSLPTDKAEEPKECGIVSCFGIHSVLRTFLAADKLSRLISVNTLTKYVSLVFAFVLIAVAFLVDGSHDKITPAFIILYQAIWSLPIIGTSIFG